MDEDGGSQVLVRPATAVDVPAMATLINSYAAQNLMLPRSAEQLMQHLPSFVVAERDGRIIGCAGLARLSPDLAEVRSLAVAADQQGRGVGRALVNYLLQAARAVGIPQVCALTLRPDFFTALGFRVVDRWDISPKLWQECIYCSKFHRCDEIAVLLNLEEMRPIDETAPRRNGFVGATTSPAWQRAFAAALGK
jgi:amino-acid N-acetyltransferase